MANSLKLQVDRLGRITERAKGPKELRKKWRFLRYSASRWFELHRRMRLPSIQTQS